MTGTRPAIGQHGTLPAGTPPTGPPPTEQLLTTLLGLGDRAVPTRHCELTAAVPMDGRVRRFRFQGGMWLGDVAGERVAQVAHVARPS